jgi:hypothetical protein
MTILPHLNDHASEMLCYFSLVTMPRTPSIVDDTGRHIGGEICGFSKVSIAHLVLVDYDNTTTALSRYKDEDHRSQWRHILKSWKVLDGITSSTIANPEESVWCLCGTP